MLSLNVFRENPEYPICCISGFCCQHYLDTTIQGLYPLLELEQRRMGRAVRERDAQHPARHCQLNGSQPDMTTTYCGHDFFEYPILYHFTFS